MNLFDDTLARIATVARAAQPALMRMRFSCKRERRYWTGFLSVTSNRRSNGKGVKSNLLHAAAAATWFYFDLLRDRAAGRTASDFKGDPSKKKSIFFSSSFFSLPPSKPQSRLIRCRRHGSQADSRSATRPRFPAGGWNKETTKQKYASWIGNS